MLWLCVSLHYLPMNRPAMPLLLAIHCLHAGVLQSHGLPPTLLVFPSLQMVEMMVGGEPTGPLGSQWVAALWGIYVGVCVAMVALHMGQQLAATVYLFHARQSTATATHETGAVAAGSASAATATAGATPAATESLAQHRHPSASVPGVVRQAGGKAGETHLEMSELERSQGTSGARQDSSTIGGFHSSFEQGQDDSQSRSGTGREGSGTRQAAGGTRQDGSATGRGQGVSEGLETQVGGAAMCFSPVAHMYIHLTSGGGSLSSIG